MRNHDQARKIRARSGAAQQRHRHGLHDRPPPAAPVPGVVAGYAGLALQADPGPSITASAAVLEGARALQAHHGAGSEPAEVGLRHHSRDPGTGPGSLAGLVPGEFVEAVVALPGPWFRQALTLPGPGLQGTATQVEVSAPIQTSLALR